MRELVHIQGGQCGEYYATLEREEGRAGKGGACPDVATVFLGLPPSRPPLFSLYVCVDG